MPTNKPSGPEIARNIRRHIDPHHLLHNYFLKATYARISIIELFQKSSKPLCAEDIHAHLREEADKSTDRHADLGTIYRTLASFEKNELITRVESSTSLESAATSSMSQRNRAFYEL